MTLPKVGEWWGWRAAPSAPVKRAQFRRVYRRGRRSTTVPTRTISVVSLEQPDQVGRQGGVVSSLTTPLILFTALICSGRDFDGGDFNQTADGDTNGVRDQVRRIKD